MRTAAMSKDQTPLNNSGNPRKDHSTTDPHIWVDPVNAMKIVENIAAGLVQADSKTSFFPKPMPVSTWTNWKPFITITKTGWPVPCTREFITSHAAFGYLARRYGLVQVPIRDLSPEVTSLPQPGWLK